MSTLLVGEWNEFGNKQDCSMTEMIDVGRALMGMAPQFHEWVKIREDRKAYQLGPAIPGVRW